MKKIFELIKQNIGILFLAFVIVLNLLVTFKITTFRYNNFEFGKFDLGNMSQMVWTTLNGKFMYLTDYFGADMPRWGMSHVDPLLLIFIPIFLVYKSPMSLVYSQLILVIFSSVLIYLIANLELKSKLSSGILGAAFLFYPAIGYLNAYTGYHGVSAAIPFFLAAFYIFELMYNDGNFSRKRLIFFWSMLILNMSGKEQIPLYIIMFGAYILFFRTRDATQFSFTKTWFKSYLNLKTTKLALSMIIVASIWFITAFFILIPNSAHYRIDGYQKFAESVGIENTEIRDVSQENYFLRRYNAFGDTYLEVLGGVITHPRKVIQIAFSGDRQENFVMTFMPILFLPFIAPQTLMIALPDFMINYLTSGESAGTAEIYNHRISMIIPVLFISIIYAMGIIGGVLDNLLKKTKFKLPKNYLFVGLSIIIFGMNIYTSLQYDNPMYLWLDQSVRKRLTMISTYALSEEKMKVLVVGDVINEYDLDQKDRSCAAKVVGIIPDNASVTGPDYLGAHLSMRHTYGIFPSLYSSADYVIVDVFSRKILSILNIQDDGLIKRVVGDVVMSSDYKLVTGCGNLFVFQRSPGQVKSDLLPIQERYEYTEVVDYPMLKDLHVVDYYLPSEVQRGVNQEGSVTYIRRDDEPLDSFIMYMTFVNKKTGENYQAANLASFAFTRPGDWATGRYYEEKIEIAFPQFLDPGEYRAFISISNKIKIRNLYLGDILVK